MKTAEDIAAFANNDGGGCLPVGIRDDKTIVGIGDTERDLSLPTSKTEQNAGPDESLLLSACA